MRADDLAPSAGVPPGTLAVWVAVARVLALMTGADPDPWATRGDRGDQLRAQGTLLVPFDWGEYAIWKSE